MATILVIEHDARVRRLLGAVLGAAGHRVRLAVSFDQGVQRYRADPADLVLLDLSRPYRDALDAILELRSLHLQARIVASSNGTATDGKPVLAMALRFGAARILLKPFRLAEVRAVVGEVLSGQAPLVPYGPGYPVWGSSSAASRCAPSRRYSRMGDGFAVGRRHGHEHEPPVVSETGRPSPLLANSRLLRPCPTLHPLADVQSHSSSTP